MLLSDLNGKNVCVLGYGKEGKAMVAALQEYSPGAEITVADKNAELQIADCKVQLGEKYLADLDRFDVIIKSPGIPPSIFASCNLQSAILTNSTEIFLEEAAVRGATVIGVTGSKGKSTTSTLIHEILKAAEKRSFLVGNIGEPAIAHVKDMSPHTARGEPQRTIFVLEMSSYQLMDCRVSPPIAVITTFFPEHLDYHGSVEAYKEAKSTITRFQCEGDFVIFDVLSPVAEELACLSPGRRIAAHADDLPIASMEPKGEHNRRNAAISFLTTRLLGVPERVSIPVIQHFRGLPHRLQSLGVRHGIEWVDDAISTTPESTIAALDALGDRVQTIILGGQDRGNDFTALGKRIATSKIRTVILFPGSGPRIRAAIEDAKASIEYAEAETMEDAIRMANKKTNEQALRLSSGQANQQTVPIVLLSTASPSYNMFKNFEEKGDVFRKCIESTNVL